MKKYFGVIIILFIGFFNMKASPQSIPTFQIPSYSVKLDGYANFEESFSSGSPNQSKEKRKVHVQVKSATGKLSSNALVLVYSLDRTTLLGPFEVNFSELLTVDVDYRDWGVVVESKEEVLVDVWFTEDKTSTQE